MNGDLDFWKFATVIVVQTGGLGYLIGTMRSDIRNLRDRLDRLSRHVRTYTNEWRKDPA